MTASNRGASDELPVEIEIDIDLDLDPGAPASDVPRSVAGPEIDIDLDLGDAESGIYEDGELSDDEIFEVSDADEVGAEFQTVFTDELEAVPADEAYDLFEIVDSSHAPPPIPPPVPVRPISSAPVDSPPDDAPATLGRLDVGKARRQFVKELQRKNEELEGQVLALHAETVVSHDRVERQSRQMVDLQGRLRITESQLEAIAAVDSSAPPEAVLAELARMRAEMAEASAANNLRVSDLEDKLAAAMEREQAASIQAASFAEEAEVFSAREATHTARIKALEAQLADTRVSLAAMQGATDAEKELAEQNESLRFRLATLEAAVGLAETKGREHRSNAMDLERELEVARALSNRAELDASVAQKLAQERGEAVESLEGQVSALQARAEVAEDAREEAEADNRALTAARDAALQRVEALEAGAEEQSQALEAAFANAQTAGEEAQSARAAAETANAELARVAASLEAAEALADELQGKMAGLERSLDRARVDLSDLEAERTAVDRKLQEAVERNAIGAATVEEAKVRVSEAEARVDAAAAQARALHEEIEGMRAELRGARVQAEAAEALADKVGALKTHLEAENATSAERLVTIDALQAAAEAAAAEHTAAMHAATTEAQLQLDEQAKAHQAAVEVLAGRIEELEEGASGSEELEQRLSASEKTVAEANRLLHEAMEAGDAARDRIDELVAASVEQTREIEGLVRTRDEALQLAEQLGDQVDALSIELEAMRGSNVGPAGPELGAAVAKIEELEAALRSVRADVPSFDLDLRLDDASEVADDLEPGELESVTSGDDELHSLTARVQQLEADLSLARDALAAGPPSAATADVDSSTLEELAEAREESRQLKARVEALEAAPPVSAEAAAQIEALRDEYADLAEAFEDLQQSHFERGKQLMNSLAEGERMRANLVRIAQELSAVREEADTLSKHAEDLEHEKRHNTGVISQLQDQLAAVADDANAVAAIPPLGSPSRPLSPGGGQSKPRTGARRKPAPRKSAPRKRSTEPGVSLFGIGDDDLAFENSQSRIPEFRGGHTQFGAPSVDDAQPEEPQRWLSSGEGASTNLGVSPDSDLDDDLDDDLFGEMMSGAEGAGDLGLGVDALEALEAMGVLDATPVANLHAARGLDHRAGFLMSMVDGHTSVRDLIDISGMPVDDVCGLIKQLFDTGALEV